MTSGCFQASSEDRIPLFGCPGIRLGTSRQAIVLRGHFQEKNKHGLPLRRYGGHPQERDHQQEGKRLPDGTNMHPAHSPLPRQPNRAKALFVALLYGRERASGGSAWGGCPRTPCTLSWPCGSDGAMPIFQRAGVAFGWEWGLQFPGRAAINHNTMEQNPLISNNPTDIGPNRGMAELWSAGNVECHSPGSRAANSGKHAGRPSARELISNLRPTSVFFRSFAWRGTPPGPSTRVTAPVSCASHGHPIRPSPRVPPSCLPRAPNSSPPGRRRGLTLL